MSTEKENLSPIDRIKIIIKHAEQKIAKLQEQLDNIPTATNYNLKHMPPGSVPSTYSFWRESQKANLRNEIENIKINSRDQCLQITKNLSKEDKEIAVTNISNSPIKSDKEFDSQDKEQKEFLASERFMQSRRHETIEIPIEIQKSGSEIDKTISEENTPLPDNYFSERFMQTTGMNYIDNKEDITIESPNVSKEEPDLDKE